MSLKAGNLYQAPIGSFEGAPPPPYSQVGRVGQMRTGEPVRNEHEPDLLTIESSGFSDLESLGIPELEGGYVNNTRSVTLSRPIAIPATTHKMGSAFLRAYPPDLQAFGLSRTDFVNILDKLNRISVKSPPLQVLSLAGTVVSFVPLQTAHLVGGVVQAASGLGSAALSKGSTEIYLRQLNKQVFGPRGLKMEIAKLDALAKVAGIPILNHKGKLDKNTPLLEPLENIQDSLGMTSQERRLRAIQPWIAPLELTDLPTSDTKSTNLLGRWSAAASEHQRQKDEKKLLKEREKSAKDLAKQARKAAERYEDNSSSSSDEAAKIEKKIEKAMRKGDVEKVEKLQRKLGYKSDRDGGRKPVDYRKMNKKYQEEMEKLQEERLKDPEEKSMTKILWVVIRNLDDMGPGGN